MPTTRVLNAGMQAGFDPRQLPGIQCWIDPSRINGFQTVLPPDNTLISSATDLSGVGHNFVQGTSTKRPTYRNTGGLTYWTGDGTDDCLTAQASWQLGNVAESIYLVYGHGAGNTGTGYILQCGGGSTRTHFQLQRQGGAGLYYTNLGSITLMAASTYIPLDSSPHLFCGWNDGVDTSITQCDGLAPITGSGVGPGNFGASAPQLGAVVATSSIGGRWYEAIICTAFHDTATRRRVQEWIAKRNKVTLARAA